MNIASLTEEARAKLQTSKANGLMFIFGTNDVHHCRDVFIRRMRDGKISRTEFNVYCRKPALFQRIQKILIDWEDKLGIPHASYQIEDKIMTIKVNVKWTDSVLRASFLSLILKLGVNYTPKGNTATKRLTAFNGRSSLLASTHTYYHTTNEWKNIQQKLNHIFSHGIISLDTNHWSSKWYLDNGDELGILTAQIINDKIKFEGVTNAF